MKKAFSLIELSIVILIIGILVAGVTQSSRLVAQMRLTSARTITQSSPVNSIRDVTLWFDATSEKAFDTADAEDAHSVTNWYTTNLASMAQTTVSQATAGYRPLYYLSKFNGLPSVYFDGSDDCLFKTNIPQRDIIQDQQVTVFVVQNFTGSSIADDTTVIWSSLGSASGYVGHRLNIGVPGGGSYMIFDSGYSDSSARIQYSIATFSQIAKPLVISAMRKNTISELRTNGGTPVVSSSTMSSGVTDGTAVLGIGCIPAEIDTAYSFQGYVGEIIVYDRALKTEERQAVEQYLGKKWGIKVS